MFTDLDDPAPPSADAGTRRRVDERTLALASSARRQRRMARGGLGLAVVAFVVVVGVVAMLRSSGHDTGTGPVAPTGDVVATWSFSGHPSATDQRATVARLNHRFAAVGLGAEAWLEDGRAVVTAPAGVHPTSASLLALAQPGELEIRPVLEAVYSLGVATPTTAPGSTGEIVASALDWPTSRGFTPVYRLGPVVVDGSAVESVSADLDNAGQWEIRPVLRAGADGIDRFNAVAAQCFAAAATCPTLSPTTTPPLPPSGSGSGTVTSVTLPSTDQISGQMAVVFDGWVLSAPTIDAPSFERDQIAISGALSRTEASQTAAMIGSGVLPAPLDVPVERP